jgi:hypothetical protein
MRSAASHVDQLCLCWRLDACDAFPVADFLKNARLELPR